MDLIERHGAIEALGYCQTYLFDSRDKDKKISLEDAEYAIEQLPSAQPEIVRCRDCKHHDGIRCFRWDSVVIITGFDDFCSNAERRTDELGNS